MSKGLEVDPDDIMVHDELEWLLILAELYWNPWMYDGEARC